MNTIIVFANQKGGVGKTTLCTLFANYLSQKDIPVLVIDCDNQQTIFEKRQLDIKKMSEDAFAYNVQNFNISNAEKAKILMDKAKTIGGAVLIDTPGNLAQQGLIQIFAQADYIICPYQYEATSVNSTITFILFYFFCELLCITSRRRTFGGWVAATCM